MEKENKEVKRWEDRQRFSIEKLPWWTELVVAQRFGMKIHPTHICHLHHCADCACIIVCSDADCRNSQMSCSDCSGKSTVSPVSKKAFHEN